GYVRLGAPAPGFQPTWEAYQHPHPHRIELIVSESYGLVASVTSQWPRLFIVGVLEVVVGIVSLIWPDVTVLVLGLLFGIVLLLSGLVVLSISWGTRSVIGVILGALAIVGAVICFIHPGAGVVAILIGCAIWFFML